MLAGLLGGTAGAALIYGWKKTQYSAEFWRELVRRCALEVVGREVPLKVTFKEVKGAAGRAFHSPDRFNRYEVEVDTGWSDETKAETIAHELAHVRQYLSGEDLSDRTALERDAVRCEHVGERVLKQMQKDGWKPRFTHPTSSQLLDKKVATQLTAEELALLDLPFAQMTDDQLDRVLALKKKLQKLKGP